LQDYLKERKQFTIVNSSESSHATTSSGAPQGSLLGPTLFSIDANDLPDGIEQGETDMFADDTTSYCIKNTHDEAFVEVQMILNQLNKWAGKNGFSIHTAIGKTEVMFISRKKFVGPVPEFSLNSNH